MANNEEMVIDVIVNGKKARVELNKVEQATNDVAVETKTSTQKMGQSWALLASKVAGMATVIGLAINSTKEFSRMSQGLSTEMKLFAKSLSLANIETDAQVAGFLKSAQTAGLNSTMMKKLAQDAIALGKAYPHESSETLHDNLVMLNTTGEAQGFVVDMLEQKYKSMEVQAMSTADKISAVEEVIREVNGAIKDSPENKIQSIGNSFKIMFSAMGDFFVGFLDKIGLLGGVSKLATYIADSMARGTQLLLLRTEYYVLALEKLWETITGIDYGKVAENLGHNILIMGKMLGTSLGLLGEHISYGLEKTGIAIKESLAEIINALSRALVPDWVLGWADKVGESGAKAAEEHRAAVDKIKAQIEDLRSQKAPNIIPDVDTSEIDAKMEKVLAAYNQILNPAETTSTTGSKVSTEWTSALDSMGAGTKAYLESSKAGFFGLKDATTRAYKGMEDALTNMVLTGKADFKDMANAIIADLARMIVKKQMYNAISSMSGGAGSFVGGLFHTGTTEVKHTGGFIGNLPSHHTGSLRQDERIAKLQVGEAVVNRAGASRNKEAIAAMNAGQVVGGEAVQQTTAEINFNVQAIDSASFNSYLVGNRQTIENIINRSLATNGSVRQTIKQTV